jgi:hypothetical protein
VAQHIVARGLEELPRLPRDLNLRFRVVTTAAPDGAIELAPEGHIDEQRLLHRLGWALDRLVEHPKKVVQHLEPRNGVPGAEEATPLGA